MGLCTDPAPELYALVRCEGAKCGLLFDSEKGKQHLKVRNLEHDKRKMLQLGQTERNGVLHNPKCQCVVSVYMVPYEYW